MEQNLGQKTPFCIMDHAQYLCLQMGNNPMVEIKACL